MRYPSSTLRSAGASALLVVIAVTAAGQASERTADNWPQFRGPGAAAVSHNPGLPDTWSASDNVEWAVEIGGMGWSSPIVWGDKVFVTSASSESPMKQPSLGVDFSNEYVEELMQEGKTVEEALERVLERDGEMPEEVKLTFRLYCIELTSGELAWQRDFYSGPPPVGRHRKNSYASETPVTDGEAVYVYIGHLGLYAFDFDGKALWNTQLEAHKVYLDFGGGASPALGGDRLFILSDNEEASFLAAFDKRSGKRLWLTPRPGLGSEQMRSAWSTPFVWENELRTEVVTVGPGTVISYDLAGKELWRMGRMSMNSIQSPYAWQGLVYVTSGAGGEPNRPIAAIRPGASGDITLSESEHENQHVVWYDQTAGGSYLPTPVIYDGGLFVLDDKGIFAKLDAKTGEQIYRSRIHREARNFTASPWAYDGKIFALNEEGSTFVVGTGDELELLGINRLDEFTMATPAIAGDRLLIRTQGKLYSIRNDAPRASATESGR